ncbi:MAG: helix-hairpin-helix domain-containing protein [Mariniphaga sp.]|nr:helix-hairpin-helix domain-containing protein [Mariniphaga sp.]
MNPFFKHITILILIALNSRVLAQQNDAISQIENRMEAVIENLNEEPHAAQIIEDLQEYAENPLNINMATRQELLKLHVLDEIQIRKLLDYLKNYGPALSIYELNAIEGFNPELLKKIEPFIRFGMVEVESYGFKKTWEYGKHEWMVRTQSILQKAKGFKEKEDGTAPFAGNPIRLYSRYKFSSGDKLSAGITAEKDPGEPFFRGVNKQGFDFYSGHIHLKFKSLIENITLGDFVVRSGQGLAIWQGFSTGKSVDIMNISKTSQGIRPFTSADENNFFRGVSTTLKWKECRVNIFWSQKKTDANLAWSVSRGNHFTSLQTSGYHRTIGEIADKNSISDMNTGVFGTWQFRNFKIGATFSYRHFSLPFIKSDQLFNQFRFSGKGNRVIAVDYLFSKGKYRFFGEGALSESKGEAMIHGFGIHLHDRIQFSGLYRHFDKNFQALWASPFAEGTSADNEKGLFLGTRILPFPYVTISAYSDCYRSDWIKFDTAGPSTGWDIFSQADVRLSKKIQFHIRYKNERKEKKEMLKERNVNHVEYNKKMRIHIHYNLSNVISLKTRVEHVIFKGLTRETGTVFLQDLQLIPPGKKLNLSARVAWFNTDSYNSRIYAYENDLLYSFSIPAYSGKGIRTYLNFKYKFNKRLEVWAKLGNTSHNDVETTGSGYNEISGNKKTEVKFQLRLKI